MKIIVKNINVEATSTYENLTISRGSIENYSVEATSSYTNLGIVPTSYGKDVGLVGQR